MNCDNFTHKVLMVRPANFGFNAETAANNAFQNQEGAENAEEIRKNALGEFDRLVETLKGEGVEVLVFEDRPIPAKPDAVFPNNWFTTHEDGRLVTYPMFSPVRRNERDPEIIKFLSSSHDILDIVGLEGFEAQNVFLEGTGSMIIDRANKLVYACLSQRTDEVLLKAFCEKFNYTPVTFTAVDPQGMPIYHTNVIMALGDGFVVICLECIPDKKEEKKLENHFAKTGLEVIPISFEQVLHFAGNMLQLKSRKGKRILAMSTAAFNSLNTAQKKSLEKYTKLVHSDISTVEKYGGGSVRCMIAEVFLPESER
ncbi:MAG: amidinotransferase [Saprospirales bacterium]|nr:MAG: amidinotransferase [Saprospirales bacterium]